MSWYGWVIFAGGCICVVAGFGLLASDIKRRQERP
jgi:hypothetical protein